jgi:hypothetical protein
MDEATPLATASLEEHCANCGAPLAGEYCSRCGQRRITAADHLSMRHFVGEAVAHVVDIEHSKMFRSVVALLIRPGLLTTEYTVGRRVDWITPLRLYLSIFAISFFLYSAFKSVAVYDLSTLIEMDKAGTMRAAIEKLAGQKHIAPDVFISAINAKWRTYLSFSQVVYPILLAVVLVALYLPQRRYLVEHVVFSIHFQAFAMLLVILAWPLYLLNGLVITGRTAALPLAVNAIMIAYIVVALRRVYQQSWTVSSVKGVLLFACYYVIYTVVTFGLIAVAVAAVLRGW